MNCEAYFELLSGHIDGENTPEQEAALQAHLRECPACRNTLALLTGLETQTAQLSAEAPPALKGRILSAIGSEAGAKKKRSRWLGSGAALGAVAAVLALLLGTGVVKLPQRSTPLPEAAVTTAPRQSGNDGNAAQTPLFEPAEDVDTAGEDPFFYKNDESTLYGGELPADTELPLEAPVQQVPVATNPASETASADSVASDPTVLRSPTRLSLLRTEDTDYCTTLSESEEAPVIAYCGLDEDFPEEVATLSPELGAALQEADVSVTEDGRIVFTMDVDTLFALHEWLLVNLPAQHDDDLGGLLDAAQELYGPISRLVEFDPDFSCMKTVIQISQPLLAEMLPEDWPEDFARCFRAETNWAMFYPAEDYQPQHGEPAYLVLIPLPAEDAAQPTNSD